MAGCEEHSSLPALDYLIHLCLTINGFAVARKEHDLFVSPTAVHGIDDVSPVSVSISEQIIWMKLSYKLEVQTVSTFRMADVVGESMLHVDALFVAIVNLYHTNIAIYRINS